MDVALITCSTDYYSITEEHILFIFVTFLTEDIDECLAEPCGNEGTCENTDGSFTCFCVEGWTGETCDGNYRVLSVVGGGGGWVILVNCVYRMHIFSRHNFL